MDLSFEVKQAIEQQVKVLLKNYGYSEGRDSCLDIVDFVQTHGFVVGNAELDDNEDGFLAIQPMESPKNTGNVPYGKVIGVNSKRTLNWKRFIIAHEFAHSVLHYEDGNIYLHRENKKGKGDEENKADYFAAALLMPKDSFKRMYDMFYTDGLNIDEICKRLCLLYKVPLDSVSRRISEVCAVES